MQRPRLQPRHVEILTILLRHREWVSWERLRFGIYGPADDERERKKQRKTLNVHLHRARTLLREDHGLPHDTIESRWAVGLAINPTHRENVRAILSLMDCLDDVADGVSVSARDRIVEALEAYRAGRLVGFELAARVRNALATHDV